MEAGSVSNVRAEASRVAVRPAQGGYATFAYASFSHALTTMLRQQRLIMAAVIAFLPVLLPLAVAFLSSSPFAVDGLATFVRLAEELCIDVLSPLMALFFATMLVGEEAEKQTIAYVLTRPAPRSAWVLGRFLAYLFVSSAILVTSVLLIFAACTALVGLGFNGTDLGLMGHYGAVLVLSLMAYGAVTMFLGAVSRRPVILGLLLVYAWQPLAGFVPGIVDFFTIRKYTDALLPELASERGKEVTQTALGEFQKQLFLIGATKAAIALLCIAALFFALTVFTVRIREYATAHAVGG